MINKVSNIKSPQISIETIRRANDKMIRSTTKYAIKNIAQSHLARKIINPNEPLPVKEVLKVYYKHNPVLRLFPSLFD